MSKKVLYFTAGPAPTAAELAEIAVLNSIAAMPYDVRVLNGTSKASITTLTLSAATADNSYNDAGATITAGTISAASADNSLNDSGNGFLTAGFIVGDYVTISGFTGDVANNTGTRRIVTVTAAKMVLSGTALVNDDAGEAVTLSAPARFLLRGFAVGDVISVSGFTGDVANNLATGVITSVTAAKMILGGTDGNAIANDSAGEAVTISTLETARYGETLITADYVAGTVPASYKLDGTAIYTVLDPANPPDVAALVETQAVISDGETVVVKTNAGGSSDNATATVAAHACTVALPATKTVVQDADTVTVDGATVTLAVSAGVVTGGTLASTKCVTTHADTVTVDGATVTLAVSGNAVTGGTLPATSCVVADTNTVSVHAQTCTLTVAGNALVSGALPSAAAVVTDAMEITITGGVGTKVTLAVANNIITGCVQS